MDLRHISQTFEEQVDKQMKELEAGVGGKLLKLNEVPGESISPLTIRLVALAKQMTGGLAKFLRIPRVASTATDQRMSAKPVTGLARDTSENTPAPAQEVYGNGLGKQIECPNKEMVQKGERRW